MTLVRIHHDGWLALPPVQRRRLGLRTGDMLEVVSTEGSLLLRRKTTAGKARDSIPPEPEAVVPATNAAGQAPAVEATAKEPRVGRRPCAAAVLPRALKARGKRPGARANAAPPGRG
jgi:bifunctional DNA-binding transcriptional regulator/antitoxin component of YhaV-PrlF toxin-antitoxin module